MEPNVGGGSVDGVELLSRTDLPVVTATAPVAFSAFYKAERRHVAAALAMTLGDPDVAAEAVDEAMVRAFQRWGYVSTLDAPAGWVYRVGLNWATSTLRRRRRPHPTPPAWSEAAFPDADLAAALSQLDVKHRSVVVCRYLFGWSEAETAAALAIRPGTVKSRLSRGLAHLRNTLEER
jgi:DNA-directed RNA polymerase specialized sigma24 family protein